MYVLFYPSIEEEYPVQIYFWENSKQLSIRQWIENKSVSHVFLSVENVSEISVNGNQGIKLERSSRVRLPKGDLTKGWFGMEGVYMGREDNVYELITTINHKYFNQMLSTFRFLE